MNTAVNTIRVWADMVKFSHSIFAIPFALMAAFLAGRHIAGRGIPEWGQLGLIIVCMVSARSVAMTFNRIADAAIDARNPRTANRPLPAGTLSTKAAWMMLALAAVTFGVACFGFYLFYQNAWPFLCAGPVLLFLCGYSLTKRFTRWSHFYLGVALAFSPPAAWLAIHPASVGVSTLWLMLAVTCWVGGFDIIYACQDIESDRREGLYSLPSRMGPAKALWVARGSHVVCLAALIALGSVAGLGSLYAVGVAMAAILLAIENCLVCPGDYSRVNLAFFTLNGLVGVVLSALTIADILLHSGAGAT